jgi:hypothetical protein
MKVFLYKLLLLFSLMIESRSRLQIRNLFFTNKPPPEVGYTGAGCGVSLVNADSTIAVMNFFAMGDTPYDSSVPPPFEGREYQCLQSTILPGMMTRANNADFIVHVGTFSSNIIESLKMALYYSCILSSIMHPISQITKVILREEALPIRCSVQTTSLDLERIFSAR